MSLVELGLTDDQARVYRQLLRGADPEALALREPRAYAVLAELRGLGLVTGERTPLAPAAAVDVLVRRRIEHARRELLCLSTAWEVLTELAEEHRTGRRLHTAEHLPGPADVTRRLLTLLGDRPADRPGELLRIATRVPPADPSLDRLPARGLTVRTLVPAGALDDPEQQRLARRRTALGDAHRVTAEPVRDLVIANRSVVLVQADPDSPGNGALHIRHPGLTALLLDLFDGMWHRACPLDDPPLTPAEHRVLHALGRYSTDETAARALGISLRKFRAHVADLKARLGAPTRFQAALLASQRGWI